MGKSDIFWKAHCKGKGKDFFSEEFKDLVTKMLSLDPNARPTMSDVQSHAWFNGAVPSLADVKAELD